MLVSLFDYELPAERIAQEPRPRGTSRLLHLDRASGAVEAHPFSFFPSLLRPGDLLVLNDTRVIPARLFAKRRSDGRVFEMLLTRHRPDEPAGTEGETWEALVRPGKKAKPGDRFLPGGGLEAELLSKSDGIFVFRFTGRSVVEALDEVGVVPLPPYIRRGAGTSSDEDRRAYQTVYARVPGAVAAPTAGLHFTDEVLSEIDRRGIRRATITLSVGPGTFKPVKVDDTSLHLMDREHFEIGDDAARVFAETREAGGRICPVGTTTVRALESSVADDGRSLRTGPGETSIFITPGYRFRAIDALLTNFHLPRSTLLMLVSAFAGRDRVLSTYERAKAERFFFYSYGDAMWIS